MFEFPCIISLYNTVCPTHYRTRHFFNNFTTNEDIAPKFEAHYRHSFSFLTQRTYSCSNFVALSSLLLELLKKCRVRQREGQSISVCIQRDIAINFRYYGNICSLVDLLIRLRLGKDI